MNFELAAELIWLALKWIFVYIQMMSPIGFKDFTMNWASWAIREEHQNAIISTELEGSWTTKSDIVLDYFNWQSEDPNSIKGWQWSSCGCECLAYLTWWGCISIGGCSGTCRRLVDRFSRGIIIIQFFICRRMHIVSWNVKFLDIALGLLPLGSALKFHSALHSGYSPILSVLCWTGG